MKKMDNALKLLILLLLVNTQSIFSNNGTFNCAQLENMTARSLRSAIVNASIVVFAKDNLIKKGLSPAELKTWNEQIDCYNSYVTEAAKKNISQEELFCSSCINQLSVINRYIQSTVNDLKKKYSSAYQDDGIVLKQLFRQGALKNLPKIQKEIARYLEEVHEIATESLKKITETTPVTSKWKKSVKADPNIVLPNYKAILKSYSPQKFTAFLNKYASNDSEAQLLMSKLEKLIYRLNEMVLAEEMKKTGSNQKAIKALKELAQSAHNLDADLRKTFPFVLTETDLDKVDAATDRSLAILLGQTDAFSGILANLLKNVTELYDAAKK